jgi:acetamidase/formamidase/DNA-binding GntR family transcriptional regulator
VRERILDDIVQGRIASGEVIQLRTLADRYEVSKTPVREALSQLQREGLVESLPYKGYFVRPVDLSEFNEICRLRSLLEGEAAELAAGNIDEVTLAQLAAIEPPADVVGMNLEYDRYAHEFHRIIARASGSRHLLELFEKLYTDVRRLQYSGLGQPSAQQSSQEHEEIVNALRNRDAVAAREAMIRHVENIRARALGGRTRLTGEAERQRRQMTVQEGFLVGREASHRHQVFDNALPPVLTVVPGEIVTFECPACALPRGSTTADFSLLIPDRPHTIVGPVRIEGAEPGDTLVVDILGIAPIEDFGQTLIIPGFGLLADEFPEPYIHEFQLIEGKRARMKPGLEIPIRPFCGIMGVAPAEPGVHITTPPRRSGGNMDTSRLVAGTTLFLPVLVEGALFSCGDGHAAQGCGEVCGTAIETALRVTLKFDLQRKQSTVGNGYVSEPQFLTPAEGERTASRSHVTTAIGPDLYDCSRRAVRHMIDYLMETRDLTRQEAYIVCSVAADLRIEEVVDQPNWLVSLSLPLDIFVQGNGS